jgi:ABC-type transport system involved in cytochrome c biogenesis permease component
MLRRFSAMAFGILIIISLAIPSQLYGYERDTLFYDDFSSGSMENWQLILGEWEIDDAKMCMLECGT